MGRDVYGWNDYVGLRRGKEFMSWGGIWVLLGVAVKDSALVLKLSAGCRIHDLCFERGDHATV